MKRIISTALLVSALALSPATPAFAVNEINTVPGLTTAGAPLALHGYDPVAFFTNAKPTLGDAKFVAEHDGAAYYFASEANSDAFKADPAKYVPQYGGYCAYGVAVGKKFDGDPRFWKIVDGKLYVNLNADIAAKFNEDVAGALKKADANWRTIESKAPAEL